MFQGHAKYQEPMKKIPKIESKASENHRSVMVCKKNRAGRIPSFSEPKQKNRLHISDKKV